MSDGSKPVRPQPAREVALVALVLFLCPVTALVATDQAAEPLARAHALIDLERAVGLFPEPAMHAWLQERPLLLEVAGAFYMWVHVPATVGLLVWLWLVRPHAYLPARRWLLCTQALVVPGYLAFPMAPPRLVEGLGFRDTLTQLYGADAAALAHSIQSPYAAMPSGHVAFAVLVAAGLAAAAPRWWLRVLAWTYPAVVTLVVMATANHLWLDAAAGAAVAGAANVLVRLPGAAMIAATLAGGVQRPLRGARAELRASGYPSVRPPTRPAYAPIRASAPFGSTPD